VKRERSGTFLAHGEQVRSSGFDGNGHVEGRKRLGSAPLRTRGAEFLLDFEPIPNDRRQVRIHGRG
jgi:hypothetical protein